MCNYVTDVINYVKTAKYLDKACFKNIKRTVGLYWETNNTCPL